MPSSSSSWAAIPRDYTSHTQRIMPLEHSHQCKSPLWASCPSAPPNTWPPSVPLLLEANIGIFGLLQLIAFTQFIRSLLPSRTFTLLLRVFIIAIFLLSFAALVILTFTGTIAPWTGRFYSLWDTGYAKIHIPIIASVSEHQPTPWPSYFFDLSWLIWLFPGGVYLCFKRLRDEHVFVIVYAVMVCPH
jgi:asparagine N-glycosylation enzyme membrane subunit Stt3